MNPKYRFRRGFTIVELLISITIGLLLSLAAVNLFITNQSTFNLQKGVSDVSDNGRFVLEFAAQQLRGAGYVPADTTKHSENWPQVIVAADDFPDGDAAVASKDNQNALGAPSAGAQGGVEKSDSLMVQYFTPVQTRDCEGVIVPAGNYVLVRLFLRADTTTGTGSALACEGGYHSGGTSAVLTNFIKNNTGGVVLLPSVDNFQVLLGISDTASGAANRPQRYVTVNTYAALIPRPPIAAIKLGLLVSSIDKSSEQTSPTQPVSVLNEVIPITSIPADGRIRRVFSTTVSLRNVL